MRSGSVVALLACAAGAAACFNVTSPDGPPPPVDPPVIACTPPSPPVPCDSPFDALDASLDSSDEGGGDAGCDAGSTYVYDPCQLPPSVCADSHWVAYFDNGICGANGQCELVTKYHFCADGCSYGGCFTGNSSTAPSRGF